MKTSKVLFLLTVISFSLLLIPTPRAGAGNPPSTPQDPFKAAQQAAQDFVNGLFKAFSVTVIPFANQVSQWLGDAQTAANKTASDFTGCPSPAAQTLYNDLKTRRDQLNQTITAATDADNRAKLARADCKNNMLMANFKYMCDAAYTAQPFAAQKGSAQTALNAVQTALTALRNMKCASGCNKTGKLAYPTVSLVPGGTLNLNQAAQAIIDVSQGDSLSNGFPSRSRATNGRVEANVCTAWDNGGFGVNLDAVGSTDLSQMVGYEAPHCSRTERVSVCTNWDMNVLLPKLKELKLVPPTVQPPDVQIVVPNKTIRVLSGMEQTSCTTPVKVCTLHSGTVTVNFNKADKPLEFLSAFPCVQWTTIGCGDPVFGLKPAYSNIQVPDLANATLRLTPKFKGAVINVDLTKGEFNLACAGRDLELPMPPKVRLGTQVVNLPLVCVEPRWVNVVANQ